MSYIYTNLVIRDYNEQTDLHAVLNLDIKELDYLELLNMSNMTFDEYIEWHLSEVGDKTKVILYDNKLVGIIGIDTDDSMLWFTTSELDDKSQFSLVRHFNKVLEYLMCDAKVQYTYCYVDATYTKSVNWAKRGGFIIEKEVYLNGNKFYIMKYTLKHHSDKLSLR